MLLLLFVAFTAFSPSQSKETTLSSKKFGCTVDVTIKNEQPGQMIDEVTISTPETGLLQQYTDINSGDIVVSPTYNGSFSRVSFCVSFFSNATGYIKLTKVSHLGVKTVLQCIHVTGSNDYCFSDTSVCGSTYIIEFLPSC
jgi:hypothetical protein